jgi:uncharacterized membrane protein
MTAERLQQALRHAAEWERHHKSAIAQPVLAADHRQRSPAQDRLAGRITDFAGSLQFVYLHTLWFGLWIVVNAGLVLAMGVGIVPFDPFPFGFLTLVVSLEAIFLSTFVMIAQNRQSAVADARAADDYAVNVRAEAEVAKLMHMLEALLEHHADSPGDARGPAVDPTQL